MKKNLYKIRLILASIVLIGIIGCIWGIIPLRITDLQVSALIQRVIFDFSIIALILILGVILLTLFFGRIYCSLICPFGIIQELFSLIFKKSKNINKNYPVKYFIMALSVGALIGGSAVILRYIDPYSIFGSMSTFTFYGIIFSFVTIVIVFFYRRFFCSNICPIGALLGLISKVSINKIYIESNCIKCSLCSKNCPTGSIDINNGKVNNSTCIKCFKCLSMCKKGAIKYGYKKPEFNIKRRDFIISAFVLGVFSSAIKLGSELSKNIAKNIKDIILPPGAIDTNRMANKCLNCNLCINNCPNKILTKADDKINAVHIDYSKGKKYCEYDCVNCSKVCPSGAIKKLTKEEKQNLRIAMAMIDSEKCNKCGLCALNCPKEAIIKTDNSVFIDGTKCIGCSLCKANCKFDAIEIYPINEQRQI